MEEKQEKEVTYQGLASGIVSLVCSIISMVTFLFIIVSIIFAAIAIICGLFSITKKNGFGKAGLIIGIISLVFTAVLFLVLNVLDVETLFMIPSWYM